MVGVGETVVFGDCVLQPLVDVVDFVGFTPVDLASS